MKGTIYGNGLPRGTQVKKGWEPLLYTKRRRGQVGPGTSPDALENKYFASAGTRTTPPYRTYCDIPAPGHELPGLKPTRLHLRGQEIIPITELVHLIMDCPLHSYYLLQLNHP